MWRNKHLQWATCMIEPHKEEVLAGYSIPCWWRLVWKGQGSQSRLIHDWKLQFYLQQIPTNIVTHRPGHNSSLITTMIVNVHHRTSSPCNEYLQTVYIYLKYCLLWTNKHISWLWYMCNIQTENSGQKNVNEWIFSNKLFEFMSHDKKYMLGNHVAWLDRMTPLQTIHEQYM